MKGTKTEISPGVWRLRVYVGRKPNGTPIQMQKVVRAPVAKPGAGVRLADGELAKMVAKAGTGKLPPTSGTVEQLVRAWLEHAEAQGRAATTLAEYRRIAEKVVIPEIGNVRLNKLTPRHLDRLYAELTKNGLKPTSVRRVHALISAALRQGERWGDIDSNVARRASPPSVNPAQVSSPTVEQVRDVIKAAERVNPTLATLLVLAALTGARRGELCALRWSDWNEQNETLTIARSVYETPEGWAEKDTKGHQERKVGLDAVAREALRRHRGAVRAQAKELHLEVPDDGFILSESPTGSEPLRPDLVTQRVRKLFRDIGAPELHLHNLRHFAATEAISDGFDPVTVGQRLGHADPSITLRVYSHAVAQRDRDLAAALGSKLTLGAG
jgi:integrase